MSILSEKLAKLKAQAQVLQRAIDEYEVFVNKSESSMWHKGYGYTGYSMQFRFDAQDESTAEAIYEA